MTNNNKEIATALRDIWTSETGFTLRPEDPFEIHWPNKTVNCFWQRKSASLEFQTYQHYDEIVVVMAGVVKVVQTYGKDYQRRQRMQTELAAIEKKWAKKDGTLRKSTPSEAIERRATIIDFLIKRHVKAKNLMHEVEHERKCQRLALLGWKFGDTCNIENPINGVIETGIIRDFDLPTGNIGVSIQGSFPYFFADWKVKSNPGEKA